MLSHSNALSRLDVLDKTIELGTAQIIYDSFVFPNYQYLYLAKYLFGTF